jgi:hypothetical protein
MSIRAIYNHVEDVGQNIKMYLIFKQDQKTIHLEAKN